MRIINLPVIMCVFALVLIDSLSWAGNEEIIEEQIQKLDALNKEAVEQVPGIPENGKINLKAHVIQMEGAVDITILQKKIEAIETKNATISLGRYQQKTAENEEGNIDPGDNLKEDKGINEKNVSIDNSQQKTSPPDRRQKAENENKNEND